MDRDIPSRTNGVVEAAKHLIFGEPHLAEQRIWCEFQDGILFLRGQVPSYYFKQLAQTAVRELRGVRQIANEIEVVW